MFDKKCVDGGRLHKYEARYNTVETPAVPTEIVNRCKYSESVVDIIKASAKVDKTYIHDICVWCGDIKK
jgi:hypothetical protein